MTFTLNTEVAAALTALTAGEPSSQSAPADWRQIRDDVASLYPVLTADLPPKQVTRTQFTVTSGDGNPVTLHWFQPCNRDPHLAGPAVVHAHGGGMIAGQVDLFAPYIAEYVAESAVPFLSVEYRLAPEATGALPGQDVYAGLQWLLAHAEKCGVDPARVAVMGESAGGGLVAAAAIRARDGGIQLARQILIYPMLDDRNVGPDPVLEPFASWPYANNLTAWNALLGARRATDDIPGVIAPARLSDHRDLAAAYIEVGELDIFRDEATRYAQALWTAGVSAELHVLSGLVHGWDQFAPDSNIRRTWMSQRVDMLRQL